ncbi:hypothetical protein ASF30_08985 [Leifsonia sp. Leaf264]|nr:hypothetical protein ASF30_08985 [Leifsonia sp. Leaf264]
MGKGDPSKGQSPVNRHRRANTDSETVLEPAVKPTLQTAEPIKHINLSAGNRHAREVARLVGEGHMDISPEYQRPSVWTQEQRINLVKSWAIGLPVPAILVNDRANWKGISPDVPWYAVVDGKQRLETAIMWFDGDLAVPASWWPEEYIEETVDTDDGPYVTYKGMTGTGQRLMSTRSPLPVIECNVGSVEEEAALFMLVNTGGTEQTADSLANAASVATR